MQAYIIQQVESFAEWRRSLRDLRAATAIRRRIERAESGNLGDVKPVGEGVSEMRIDVGAGYRVYFTIRERVVLFLLGWRQILPGRLYAEPSPCPRSFES